MKRIVSYTSPFVNEDVYEGETIETKVERVVNNNEPITDGAPLLYTERKNGVEPAFDVRTDRWDLAVDAMDLVTKDKLAKRAERIEEKEKEKKSDEPSQQTTTE